MCGLLVRAVTWPAALGEALLRRTGLYAQACELLYGKLAWAYDAAAWLASGGRWNTWQRVALQEAIAAGASLVAELGPGTGHGLAYLTARGAAAVGIEPSPQMLAHARRRAPRAGLVRGRSQQLPLRGGTAGAVVCTFPGNWITDPATWCEIERVLRPGGRVVVLASAAPGRVPPRWPQSGTRPAFLPPGLSGSWCVRRGPWGSMLLLVAAKDRTARSSETYANASSALTRA